MISSADYRGAPNISREFTAPATGSMDSRSKAFNLRSSAMLHRMLRFAPLLLLTSTLGIQARPPAPLHFSISFPAARSARPLDGRVLLFISDDEKTEPRLQSDQ